MMFLVTYTGINIPKSLCGLQWDHAICELERPLQLASYFLPELQILHHEVVSIVSSG